MSEKINLLDQFFSYFILGEKNSSIENFRKQE
jgi:hypothetical protein